MFEKRRARYQIFRQFRRAAGGLTVSMVEVESPVIAYYAAETGEKKKSPLPGKKFQQNHKHTFTLTVLPNATSNLHSDPLGRLCCVGGTGALRVSWAGSVSSSPGRDISLWGLPSNDSKLREAMKLKKIKELRNQELDL